MLPLVVILYYGEIFMKIKIIVRLACIFLTVATLFGAGYAFYSFFHESHQRKEQEYKKVTSSVQQAAHTLTERFDAVVQQTEQIVHWLNTHRFDEVAYRDVTQKIIIQSPDIFGFDIAFEPYVLDPKERLYSIRYREADDGTVQKQTIAYDYTVLPDKTRTPTAWYTNCLKNGAGWSEPFFDADSQQAIIKYHMPFYGFQNKGQKKIMGVVAAIISLQDIRSMVNALEFGAAGYAFIISPSGAFASHPTENYVTREYTIFQAAQEMGSESLVTVAKQVIKKKSGSVKYYDEIGHKKSSLFYLPIAHTNLILCATFALSELTAPYADQLKNLMLWRVIALTAALCALVLFMYVFRFIKLSFYESCALIGLVLFVGIGGLWFVMVSSPRGYESVDIMLSQNKVTNFVNNVNVNDPQNKPIVVKTGLLVQSLHVISSDQIKFGGFVWQRYPLNTPAQIKRDFYINTVDKYVYKNVIAQYKTDKEEIILWQINGELTQNQFDSKNYPFDREDIEIILSHPEQEKMVLLVPDISAYDIISPWQLPGLQEDVDVSGKQLVQSYFSIQRVPAIVGISDKKTGVSSDAYNLVYTIVTSHWLTDILFLYLLPILISLLLLLIIPLIAIKTIDSSMGAVGACAGIFLSLMVAHTGLRNALPGAGVSYLEYFYISLYVIICLIIVQIIMFYFAKRESFFAHIPPMAISQLLTPLYLLINFIITAVMFLQ